MSGTLDGALGATARNSSDFACSRRPKQPDGIESDKQPDQAEYETGHVPSPLQRR